MKNQNKAAITIIESPEYDVMDQAELSEILGGWNCGSYTHRLLLWDTCKQWDKKPCTGNKRSHGYCLKYTFQKL